jgi:hypothetical protein
MQACTCTRCITPGVSVLPRICSRRRVDENESSATGVAASAVQRYTTRDPASDTKQLAMATSATIGKLSNARKMSTCGPPIETVGMGSKARFTTTKSGADTAPRKLLTSNRKWKVMPSVSSAGPSVTAGAVGPSAVSCCWIV